MYMYSKTSIYCKYTCIWRLKFIVNGHVFKDFNLSSSSVTHYMYSMCNLDWFKLILELEHLDALNLGCGPLTHYTHTHTLSLSLTHTLTPRRFKFRARPPNTDALSLSPHRRSLAVSSLTLSRCLLTDTRSLAHTHTLTHTLSLRRSVSRSLTY